MRRNLWRAVLFSLWISTAAAAQGPVAPQPWRSMAPSRMSTSRSVEQNYAFTCSPRRRELRPTPAIVFFFGGAWTNGIVGQFVPQAKHLAERGMVAIVADYRVFSRHATTAFEAIADAKSAIRWVRVACEGVARRSEPRSLRAEARLAATSRSAPPSSRRSINRVKT